MKTKTLTVTLPKEFADRVEQALIEKRTTLEQIISWWLVLGGGGCKGITERNVKK